jgi:hypothetical protein
LDITSIKNYFSKKNKIKKLNNLRKNITEIKNKRYRLFLSTISLYYFSYLFIFSIPAIINYLFFNQADTLFCFLGAFFACIIITIFSNGKSFDWFGKPIELLYKKSIKKLKLKDKKLEDFCIDKYFPSKSALKIEKFYNKLTDDDKKIFLKENFFEKTFYNMIYNFILDNDREKLIKEKNNLKTLTLKLESKEDKESIFNLLNDKINTSQKEITEEKQFDIIFNNKLTKKEVINNIHIKQI